MREEVARKDGEFDRQMLEALYKAHEISFSRYEQLQLDSLAAQHRAEIDALDKEIALHSDDVSAQQKALAKKEELEQEYALKVKQIHTEIMEHWQQILDRQNDVLTSHLRQWALGQVTLKKAFQDTWNSIVLDLASTLAKMGLKWVEHWALVHLLHIGAKAAALSVETAQAAAKHAILASANVAEVTSDAAVAAAAGFKSAMEALPWPANMAVAPVVAASAMAQTLAFAPL